VLPHELAIRILLLRARGLSYAKICDILNAHLDLAVAKL
jgi:hypothetical protein